MSSPSQALRVRAGELVADLQDSGHSVTLLALLDVLATAGMTLADDELGTAALAFREAVNVARGEPVLA